MEAKFFAEIEKNMDIKTIKDFEKEVRSKIYNEIESLRKKNNELSKFLMNFECNMWEHLKYDDYFGMNLTDDKKKKLNRLIEIYVNFKGLVDTVNDINTKIDKVKKLKNKPVDSGSE